MGEQLAGQRTGFRIPSQAYHDKIYAFVTQKAGKMDGQVADVHHCGLR